MDPKWAEKDRNQRRLHWRLRPIGPVTSTNGALKTAMTLKKSRLSGNFGALKKFGTETGSRESPRNTRTLWHYSTMTL